MHTQWCWDCEADEMGGSASEESDNKRTSGPHFSQVVCRGGAASRPWMIRPPPSPDKKKAKASSSKMPKSPAEWKPKKGAAWIPTTWWDPKDQILPRNDWQLKSLVEHCKRHE